MSALFLPTGLYHIINVKSGRYLEVSPGGPLAPLVPLPSGAKPTPFVLQSQDGIDRYYIRYAAYIVIPTDSKVFGSVFASTTTWRPIATSDPYTFGILAERNGPVEMAWTMNLEDASGQVTLQPVRGELSPAQLFKIFPIDPTQPIFV